MKPRLSRFLQRVLAGVVVCCPLAQADSLEWAGTADSLVWDTTAPNWLVTGTTTPKVAFGSGDDVTFVSPIGTNVSATVDVASELTAGAVAVNEAYTFNATQNASISGSISGTGTLTKTGIGVLTLTSTNNNTTSNLALSVTEGELVLAGANTYGTASTATGAYINVAQGADITFKGAVTATDITNEGTLHIKADSKIDSIGGEGTLVVGEEASAGTPTVTLTNAAFIATLENYGTLEAQGGLTLTNATAQGGTVNTPRLTLEQNGNTFTSVSTDLLQVATPDAATATLTTTEIAPATADRPISVEIENVVRTAEKYTIVNVTGDNSADTSYSIDPATQALYRAAGFELTVDPRTDGGLALTLNRIPSRYFHNLATTSNGTAGADLIQRAFLQEGPQWNRGTRSDLANVMDHLDTLIAAGTPAAASAYDQLAASVAGPGVASLGIAWRTQMERQLRNIRDRVSTMNGGIPCCTEPDPKAGPVHSPRYTMWANADIDYQDQHGSGALPGFKLNGVGGTIGMAGHIGTHWTVGGALSGMAGRISSKGYGSDASGDLDSYYVSLFARYDKGCWTHSLNGAVGIADVDFKRRVYHADGAYSTKGTPDGLGLGIMYEVTRSYRINQNYMASAWMQPVLNVAFIHSSIDSYTESGSDAALHVGKQDYNNVILGLGARMQTLVGHNIFNTDSVFNLRVLGKALTGKRRGSADVSINGIDGSSRVNTSERGSIGLELGGGLAIPLGTRYGNIFAECTAEFMSNYRTVNGAVGYRIDF